MVSNRIPGTLGRRLEWCSFIFVHQIWVKPIRARGLYKHGASTPGQLLHKRARTGKSSAYYVSYRFTIPFPARSTNPKSRFGKQRIGGKLWKASR